MTINAVQSMLFQLKSDAILPYSKNSSDLYSVDISSNNVEKIADLNMTIRHVMALPTNNTIVLVETSPDGHWVLWKVDMDGTNLTEIIREEQVCN